MPFEGEEKQRRNCCTPMGCEPATTNANSTVNQEDETEVTVTVAMLRRISCSSNKQGLTEGIPVARLKVISRSLARSQTSSLT
jgi:hypothetical protein